MGESMYPCANCGINPAVTECPECGYDLCDSCLSSGDCPNCGGK